LNQKIRTSVSGSTAVFPSASGFLANVPRPVAVASAACSPGHRTCRGSRALSDLQAAAAALSSSGQIEGKKAKQLSKRVDGLAKHVTEKGGKEAG
jgi:hypothetical protein